MGLATDSQRWGPAQAIQMAFHTVSDTQAILHQDHMQSHSTQARCLGYRGCSAASASLNPSPTQDIQGLCKANRWTRPHRSTPSISLTIISKCSGNSRTCSRMIHINTSTRRLSLRLPTHHQAAGRPEQPHELLISIEAAAAADAEASKRVSSRIILLRGAVDGEAAAEELAAGKGVGEVAAEDETERAHASSSKGPRWQLIGKLFRNPSLDLHHGMPTRVYSYPCTPWVLGLRLPAGCWLEALEAEIVKISCGPGPYWQSLQNSLNRAIGIARIASPQSLYLRALQAF